MFFLTSLLNFLSFERPKSDIIIDILSQPIGFICHIVQISLVHSGRDLPDVRRKTTLSICGSFVQFEQPSKQTSNSETITFVIDNIYCRINHNLCPINYVSHNMCQWILFLLIDLNDIKYYQSMTHLN